MTNAVVIPLYNSECFVPASSYFSNGSLVVKNLSLLFSPILNPLPKLKNIK